MDGTDRFLTCVKFSIQTGTERRCVTCGDVRSLHQGHRAEVAKHPYLHRAPCVLCFSGMQPSIPQNRMFKASFFGFVWWVFVVVAVVVFFRELLQAVSLQG